MEQSRAFAPGNISCVFKVIEDPDPTRMHSLGMGFTVREGVEAKASPESRNAILFNGEETDFPTVATVVQKLSSRPLRVELSSSLPLSSGFGLSGAAALATAYAVDDLLGAGHLEEELAMIAHVAEVENLTGLGDVCAQFHGGCMVKMQPGYPLAAQPLPVPDQPIYYRYFSPIHTRDVLKSPDQKERINRAADAALKPLAALLEVESLDFDACIRVSRSFAVDSGLLRDQMVRQLIQQVEDKGGAASMIMLGNAVFSTRGFAGAEETMLCNHCARVLR